MTTKMGSKKVVWVVARVRYEVTVRTGKYVHIEIIVVEKDYFS